MATRHLGSKGEAFHLEGQTWTCKNELPSDVIIDIGEISFHLHKFPLLSRSGLFQKMVSEFHGEDDGKGCTLQLHDLPGGPKTFELVAKFCYDVRFELTVLNAVALRCAAEHLLMAEDLAEGNLIAQTETFLDETFDKCWNDTMRVLETCEPLLPLAEDLRIVSRCIDALATKACSADHHPGAIFGWPLAGTVTSTESPERGALWNGIGAEGATPRSPWWHEDASSLSLPMYKRLVVAIGSKGMKPENIVGSLKNYATKHLPILSSASAQYSDSDQRTTIHAIVELLPTEKGVCSTRFLVALLRAAMVLRASPSCCEALERRVGAQLDEATLEDVLIPNLGYSVETLYDVDCVRRIVESFVSECRDDADTHSATPALADASSMTAVAKLLDGYLSEVAPDVNLKFLKFQSLAAAIPSYARVSDDGIYRAVDIYLKTHPWVSDSDREQLCRLMNCQKLSLEACTHAAQNERLPLRVVVQVLFFEQLRLRTAISGWFFLSDAPRGNAHAQQAKLDSSIINGGLVVGTEITEEDQKEPRDDDDADADDDKMKVRVSELERECWVLKEELQQRPHGKSRGFWDRFCSKFASVHKSDKQQVLST